MSAFQIGNRNTQINSFGPEGRNKTHQISNNLELISDGSITEPLRFEVINGEIFINDRKVEL